ncbi:MAG: c-type cytochrome [Deltaproteobacteria bacterium]|nr:c-type cytochrome [Deltaproteobacteria bacterium]
MVKEGLVLLSAFLLTATEAWAQGDPALIAKGEKIYVERNCVLCHTIKGKGGTAGPIARGPDLTVVGTRRDVEWLKTFLKDPKAVNAKSKKMPFRGSEEELELLAEYLSSLK